VRALQAGIMQYGSISAKLANRTSTQTALTAAARAEPPGSRQVLTLSDQGSNGYAPSEAGAS
jgi:hypothetical protein